MSKEMDEAGTRKHPKSFRDFAVLPAGAPKWTAPPPTSRAVSISSRQALRTLTNSPAWIHLDIRFCPTKVPRCLVSSGEIVANTTSSSQQPPSFTCRVLACRPSDDRSPDTLVSCDASWREVRIKCQLANWGSYFSHFSTFPVGFNPRVVFTVPIKCFKQNRWTFRCLCDESVGFTEFLLIPTH